MISATLHVAALVEKYNLQSCDLSDMEISRDHPAATIDVVILQEWEKACGICRCQRLLSPMGDLLMNMDHSECFIISFTSGIK
jgi:hypothetical protein